MVHHLCPICGFDGLDEPAYDGRQPSFEICPSCGNQFGYDDAVASHASLRQKWISKGARWWSREAPPEGWEPQVQLARVMQPPSSDH